MSSGVNDSLFASQLNDALKTAPRRSDYQDRARTRTLSTPLGLGVDYSSTPVVAPPTATKGLGSIAESRAAERSFYASKPVSANKQKFDVHFESRSGEIKTASISGEAIMNARREGSMYFVDVNGGDSIPVSKAQMKMLQADIFESRRTFNARYDAWREEGQKEGFFAGPNERN